MKGWIEIVCVLRRLRDTALCAAQSALSVFLNELPCLIFFRQPAISIRVATGANLSNPLWPLISTQLDFLPN